MKSRTLLILLLAGCCFSCSSKEIVVKEIIVKNPDIDDMYISYVSRITSERKGNFIIPSYEINFTKETDKQLKKFSFRIVYHYGQDFMFTDNHVFSWPDNDEYLQMLNGNGTVTFKYSMDQFKREPLFPEKGDNIYLEPDGEILSVSLDELIMTNVKDAPTGTDRNR